MGAPRSGHQRAQFENIMKRSVTQAWYCYHHLVYAVVIAIACTAACKYEWFLLKISNDFLSTSITILAIVIGFIGTMQTVLLSLQSTKVVRDLKLLEFRKGLSYYRLYLKQLHSVIANGFLAIFISLILFIFNEPDNSHLNVNICSTLHMLDAQYTTKNQSI